MVVADFLMQESFIHCLFIYFLIGVKLFYNVVLASAVQRSESAICIHISPPSWTSLSTPIPSI